jgi:hypothetical protein
VLAVMTVLAALLVATFSSGYVGSCLAFGCSSDAAIAESPRRKGIRQLCLGGWRSGPFVAVVCNGLKPLSDTSASNARRS